MKLLSALPLGLLLGFPLLEIGAHAWTRAHVPSHAEFAAAAAFIRPRLLARDLVTSAPEWTDPILRETIGDRIDLAMAGRSDSALYERLWAMSIRGARPAEAGAAEPELAQRFGEVTVLRYALGKSRVRYHFTPHLPQASVELVTAADTAACRVRRHPFAPGGGLGVGILPPKDRIGCEGTPDSVFVAQVVVEDLWLRPRYCVFQPVAAPAALRTTFHDVPLADELVFYGGIYYEDERMRRGAPIDAKISINGQLLATMHHVDGDGWKRLVVPTHDGTADVSVEVSGATAHKRRFCWDATTRSTSPEGP